MSYKCSSVILYGICLTDEQMTEICDVHYDIRENREYEDFIFFLNEITGERPFIGTYVLEFGEANEICMSLEELNRTFIRFGLVNNPAKVMQKDIVKEIIKKLRDAGMDLKDPQFYIATRIL